MNVDARVAAVTHAAASSATPASHIDADPRDNVIAYRNMLAGVWASRLMQTPDDAIQSYVAAVHQADLGEPGRDSVIEKLFGEMNRCGVSISARKYAASCASATVEPSCRPARPTECSGSGVCGRRMVRQNAKRG